MEENNIFEVSEALATDLVPETKNNGALKKAAIGVGVAGAIIGVGLLVRKKLQGRIDKFRANRLKKRGYTVLEPLTEKELSEIETPN